MSDLVFYAVVALLITHELDAVQRHEWRLLPVLRGLPEVTGFQAFTLLHVPLFVLFFWLMEHPSSQVRTGFQIGLAAFAVVHVWLHWLLRHHPKYEFHNSLSRFLILGAGIAGGAHLGLLVA